MPSPFCLYPGYCRDQSSVAACLQDQCYQYFNSSEVKGIFNCITEIAPCYFQCLNITSSNPFVGSTASESEEKIKLLVAIGRAGAICSIVASTLFLLISVYIKRYQRWIEQIILSKVVCDMSFAAVLLYYFETSIAPMVDNPYSPSSTSYSDDTFYLSPAIALQVVLMLGLLWIPVLLNEVRNIITFPFSAWSFSKLFNRWFFALVVSFCWTSIIAAYRTSVSFFQYVPLLFIGRSSTSLLNT
jgi:hypothetical protein